MRREGHPYTVTKKGTVIHRHQWVVGKDVKSGQIYAHRRYAHLVAPVAALQSIERVAKVFDLRYNCIMYNPKTGAIRADWSLDFDTAREPHTGWTVTAYPDGTYGTPAYYNSIWHHKWLWVMDDYPGFDVEKSLAWSDTYAPILNGVPKATDRTFQEQLAEVGLE